MLIRTSYSGAKVREKTPQQGIIRVGEGLSGLQHFWEPDANTCGYGAAVYMSAALIAARLHDLQTGAAFNTKTVMGDFSRLTRADLAALLADLFDDLTEEAGISLSELKTAVISGTTEMECMLAGLEQHELALYGTDIEYLMVGANAIAVGQAYYVPCVSAGIGGDFLCGLLAINILQSENPICFVSTGYHAQANTLVAYGTKGALSACVLPSGQSVEQGLLQLLKACETERALEHIVHVVVAGDGEVELPDCLRGRARRVRHAAIEGASAVLVSEYAEDELCRIVSACQVVNL